MRRPGTTPPSQQCYDLGIQKVEAWLEDWLGPHTLVSLKRFEIDAGSLVAKTPSFVLSKKYKDALTKNQSRVHGHLKYLARLWLETQPSEVSIGGKPDYEVGMYFPDYVFLKRSNFKPSVGYFDFRKPQLLLPKGRRDVDASFGRTTYADVLGNCTSIEVGRTSPFNLCMPLLERLVSRSIWIPFPVKGFTARTDPLELNLAMLSAYEIQAEVDESWRNA
jgi:hypothetical protein